MGLKEKEGWLECDFFVIVIGIRIIGLNSMLKGEYISLVMSVVSDGVWC